MLLLGPPLRILHNQLVRGNARIALYYRRIRFLLWRLRYVDIELFPRYELASQLADAPVALFGRMTNLVYRFPNEKPVRRRFCLYSGS